MSNLENVNIQWQDTGNVDAFGRARVSQVTTQFDAKQLHDALPLFIDEELIGGATATHSTTLAQTAVEVTSNLDAAVLQTRQRFNYQSGKSQLIFFTFNGFDNQADTTKRVGYFSSTTTTPFNSTLDGLWLESDGTSLRVKTERSGTSTSDVARVDWDDSLDGTGESGVTHDFDNNTILMIDFEWLGVGAVTWYVVKNRIPIQFHRTEFTETTDVYMSSPNQPLRWECRAAAATGGTGFNFICSSVNSEGSLNQIGKIIAVDDDGTHLNANSTASWYVAIGLKLQAAKVDTLVDLIGGYLLSDTNDKFIYRVLVNPTYNGTITYTNVTNSSMSYGLGAAANDITDDGTIVFVGGGDSDAVTELSVKNAIRLGMGIAGTTDEIVVVVKPLTSNLDIHRGLAWRELT